MKVGILGGTFDPIHNGHLRMAIEALETLYLDKVILEVARISPFRANESHSSSDIRAQMVRDAIRNDKFLELGLTELNRDEISYTIDTLRHYDFQDVTLIMGADSLADFSKWKEPGEIVKIAKIATLARSGTDLERVLDSFPEDWRRQIHVVNCPILDISASQIRDYVRQGRSISHLVPDSVLQTIIDLRLYS